MKKYLILALSILSIFFVSEKVEALSFTDKGQEIEVNESNLIYYIYSTYQSEFDNYPNFFLFKSANSYKIYFTNTTLVYSLGSFELGWSPTSYSYCVYNFNSSFEKTSNGCYEKTGRLKVSIYSGDILLVANTLEGSHSSVSANNIISKQDLIDYFDVVPIYKITYYLNNEIYKEIEVEKGSSHQLENYSYNSDLYNFTGWSIENDLDISNITSDIIIRGTLEQKVITPLYIKNFNDFPITKTEFYSLLVMIAILMLMLFLRWCFPMKGGKNL